MINKKSLIRFTFNILIFAIFVAGVHFLVFKALPLKIRTGGLVEMHIFLILLTFFMHVLLLILLRKKKEYMGYGFIGASFMKMIICILFLLPEILNKKPTTDSYVFQFFGLYFAYLTFEVVVLVKELKSKDAVNKTD
ncbi:MAG: hypothetical protein ABIJ97_09765 [Bacteroidota bacterium]